jgi:tripartite-type tricarboxylate transporter receptor subunit TctC
MNRFFGRMLALLLASFAGAATAQTDYPARPVRLIVPFAAGGPTDLVGRLMAQEYQSKLGQPFIVENRPGATGMIGLDMVMKSPPDGYAITILANTTTNNFHQTGRTFDFAKQVSMIGQIYSSYTLVLVNPAMPGMSGITNLAQLVAYAKANPGKLDVTSAGAGSTGHLAVEKIRMEYGIRLEHINYKGLGPALADVLAGRVPLLGATLVALPHIRSGKLRAIGTGAPRRLAALPEVPTFIEQGIPGMVSGSWVGLAGPAGLPAPVLARLSQELQAALARPEVAEKVRSGVSAEPEFMAPAEFAASAQRDFEYWGRVIREAGIKVEQ